MTDNGNLLIGAQTEMGEGLPQLQRGGEALALEICRDRFTFCPPPQQSVAAILATLNADQDRLTTRAILPSLTEICVPAERVEDLMQVARRSGAAFVSLVYQMRQSPGTLVYPTDQITVQFAETIDSGRMQQLTALAGLRILKLIAGVPKAFVFQIARDPLKLADWLIQQPEVLLAEPNVAILRQPYYRPRESGYAQQWYLNHEGGEALANGSHIFAEAAWNLTRGKRSIAIAVVDERIDLRHPDLQSEGKIVAPLDLPLDLPLAQTGSLSEANPELSQAPTQKASESQSHESHGTALARLITADETGKGMIGVAPGCALMPIQIGQFIDDQVIEQVCQWVIEQKADVLCCGWGAAATYFPLSLRQRVALSQAATQGRDGRGCVIVFAAGNANRPIDGIVLEQGWPNQLLQGETLWLNGFAVHPDVITVAACTSLNQKSACSNWGANIAVAAPGGQSAPLLYTQLAGEVSTGPSAAPQPGRQLGADPSSAPLGDTSGACGIVAGVAALMLSVNPDLTAREVQQILQQTADRIVDQAPDAQLGLSLGSYDATRYSAWFGSGKVNAIRAVELAQRALLPLPLPDRWVQYRQLEPLDIPDGNPQGLVSKVQVLEAGLIRDIEVSVEIEHEFLGDLTLSLVAPWGKAIALQSRALGRLTRLKTTYSLETVFWFKALLNHPAQGEWQLRVIDQIPTRTGWLQTWQLNLGL
jgi:subtilisin family serine protease